jgi:sucrase/ferredoxin-like protein
MWCADAARVRGEPLQASAVRYSRFLLLEVPGPWGTSALEGRHLEAGVARRLGRAAADSGTHVLLIRRAGRQPSAAQGARPLAWAIADTTAGVERVQWGSWRDPAELPGLDLAAALPAGVTGPQSLALVCTNGKRDQCCAVRGRPVAAALAAAGWDTWECSHLGGHRFAATMMLLPTGDMFGWLDPESAVAVMRRFDAGELVPSHYRGRCGQPAPVQAALHAAAVRLGDFRRGAIRASGVRPLPADGDGGRPAQAAEDGGRWEVEIVHRAARGQETAHHVVVTGSALAPTFLSCGDGHPKAEIHYEARSFSRIP